MAKIHMKHLLPVFNIIMILTTFFTTASAQTTFFKYYDDSLSLSSPGVIRAANNHLLIKYWKSEPFGFSVAPFMLLKVDENGSPIWDRVISNVFEAQSIGMYSDNSFYGWSDEFPFGYGLVFSFDSIGDMSWSRKYYNANNQDFEFRALIRHDDSTFYFFYDVYPGLFGNYDVSGMAKLSSNGAIVWSNIYELNAVMNNYPNNIQVLNDGSVVMLTQAANSLGSYICMMKADSSGSITWAKKILYPNQPDTLISSVSLLESKSGKIVLVANQKYPGSNPHHLFLMQFDPSSGNLDWGGQYSANIGMNGSLYGRGAVACEDGGFAIYGDPYLGLSSGQDVFILKLDSTGNVEWSYKYGGVAGLGLYGNLVETTDQGFALTGQIDAGYHGSSIFLLRTDSLGNTSCSMSPMSVTHFPGLTPVTDTTSMMAYHCDLFSVPYNPFINSLDTVIERDYCIGLGLIEGENEFKMEVFPNPAVDQITVRLNSNSMHSRTAEVKMSNIHGEIVYHTTLFNNVETINCMNFAPGLYIIQLVANEEVFTEKVLVTNR